MHLLLTSRLAVESFSSRCIKGHAGRSFAATFDYQPMRRERLMSLGQIRREGAGPGVLLGRECGLESMAFAGR